MLAQSPASLCLLPPSRLCPLPPGLWHALDHLPCLPTCCWPVSCCESRDLTSKATKVNFTSPSLSPPPKLSLLLGSLSDAAHDLLTPACPPAAGQWGKCKASDLTTNTAAIVLAPALPAPAPTCPAVEAAPSAHGDPSGCSPAAGRRCWHRSHSPATSPCSPPPASPLPSRGALTSRGRRDLMCLMPSQRLPAQPGQCCCCCS